MSSSVSQQRRLSSTSGGMPSTAARPIKRKRPMLSCVGCRSRRLKCDKAQPRCGRCVDSGNEECVYVNHAIQDPASEEGQRSSKRNKTVKLPDHGGLARTSSGSRKIETKLTKSKSLGHLSTSGGGKSKYVSGGFWACVGTVKEHIDELLQSQNEPLTFSLDHGQSENDTSSVADYSLQNESINTSRTRGDSHISDQVPGSLELLVKGLPPRETCDMLCKEYFASVHPIVPIIHGPSFEKQYNALWLSLPGFSIERMRSGIMAKNPSFLALLFAVLFAASTTCSADELKPHFNGASNRSVSLKLLSLTKASLTLVSFPQSPALDSLSAYLVSQNMLMREEEAITTCSFVGIALRIAQGMGLHRDGLHFNLDPIQVEVRRRVWWYLIHTDVLTSIGCGLPSIWVDDGSHDTQMISEHQDGLESESSDLAPDDEYQNDPRFVVAVGRYSITSLLRNLLRRQVNVKPFARKDVIDWGQRIESLGEDIKDRIRRLDKICTTNATKSKSIHHTRHDTQPSAEQGLESLYQLDPRELGTFCSWGSCLLRMMVEKAHCLLYQPLIRDSSGSLWQEFRSASIQHCHAFLTFFLETCTNNSFRSYHWLYPGIYQALQPMAMILADLCQQPESSEAEKSRQLMDKVFAILGPDGQLVTEDDAVLLGRRLSAGGQKAWSVLYRMKREAWTKAGLDPDVVWVTQHTSSQTHLQKLQAEQNHPSKMQGGQAFNISQELPVSPRRESGSDILGELVINDNSLPTSYRPSISDPYTGRHGVGLVNISPDDHATELGGTLSDFNFSTNGYLFDWNEWGIALPENNSSLDDFIQ